MGAQNYQDLVAWQKAMDLVEDVYAATRLWPKEELYGLTNQVRRAVVSVAANIAEGQGWSSSREFLRYVSVAHGSLREVETHLLISQRLNYKNEAICNGLMKQAAEVGRLLQGLMKHLQSLATPAG